MKISIDYLSLHDDSSNPTIVLEPSCDVTLLNEKIEELYGIPPSRQILRYTRDSYTLKLIPGWPLSYYFRNQEEVTISLDIVGNTYCAEEYSLHLQPGNMMTNYQAYIGLYEPSSPNKTDLDEFQKNKSSDDSSIFAKDSLVLLNKSDTSSEAGSLMKASSKLSDTLNILRSHSGSPKHAHPLIQAAKAGNLENFRDCIRETRERRNSGIGRFIDETDNAGWNSLHWSVFRAQSEIVQELIKEGTDVNKLTKDDWTPLQLAVFRNYTDIVKILLEVRAIDINKVTSKTSAIHIAAKTGHPEIIRILAENGADLKLKSEKGLRPLDVTKDAKIRNLLEELISNAEAQEKALADTEKIYIVKGWMFKKSTKLKILNNRYFILNFKEGTLTRYKKLEHYPYQPHEITFLTDIGSVRRIKPGFLDKKNLFYIEMNCAKKIIFACRNQDVADKWVFFISKGIAYARSMGKNIPSESRELQLSHNILSENIEEVEIQDNKGASIIITTHSQDSKINRIEQTKVTLDDFSIIEEIGHGGFAKVFKVIKKSTGKYYALKAMKKQELMLKRSLKYAVSEVNILKKMDSPYTLRLYYAFQTRQHLCLVLDYCSGGDLSSYLSNKGIFSEDEARFFIAELILAIESLHEKDVIYRDLKPDNILFDKDGHIKLADFGLAREGVKNLGITKSICGSPAYLSPEVVTAQGAGRAADMYGIGVILYEMLVGCSPYFSRDLQELYNNIISKKIEIPKRLSKDTRNLIKKLVNRNPNKRIGVKNKLELKKHPFFKGIDWGKLGRKELQPPASFGERSICDQESDSTSILLDKEDTIIIDGISHVPNFTYVAKELEE